MHKQLVIIIGLLIAATLSAQGWGPDIRLTNDPASSTPSMSWSVANNGDTVHVVWWDHRDGNAEIYYKRSLDGGLNWDDDTCLLHTPHQSVTPLIAVSGSNLHVIWREDFTGNTEVYYKRSTDGGITWSSDINLTNTPGYSQCLALAVFGNNVYIAWQEASPSEIYYKRSTDNGTTWDTNTRLTYSSGESVYPKIAAAGPNTHLVWQDNRDGNAKIFYKHSTNNGLNWSDDICLTNGAASSYEPVIAVSGSNLHVTWFDNRDGNFEIFYKRSTDNGLTWEPDTQLTNTGNTCATGNPSIAVLSSNVHLTWHDNRDGGDPEIYYKHSADNGTNWGPDTRLTNASGESSRSSVAVASSRVDVVWGDTRDENSEIYYKRGFLPKDVGPDSIVSPQDTVWKGFPYTPRATGKNFESVEASFNVVCEFDSAGTTVYSDTVAVENLTGGATIQVSFADWIPASTGQYAMCVTTLLEGDCNPSNDLMSKIVISVLPPRDVVVISIDSPQATVWSEHTYTPQATFKNLFLYEAANFNAVCEFDSADIVVYSDTVAVTGLGGDSTQQVSFEQWTACEANGLAYTMTVKTLLDGDVNPDNDTLSKVITVIWPPRDVAPVTIITPPDFVWSGFAHIPRVVVKNLWEEVESFDVACMVDSLGISVYFDTAQVVSLAGGDSILLEFEPWSAGATDTFTYNVTFITQLAKDLNHSNDTITKEIHAVKEVADIDIQDYAGNLSANTMFLTGARNAILVGSYIMVNPDNWQKNVDLYDGPANTNLTLSYDCTDLVLYNGQKTIPAESVQVNSNQIATLALGDARLNIVQVSLFHTQAPNDPQHFVGTVTVIARGEGMVVSDEFTLEVKQVAGTAPLAASLCFGGEPLPEGNHLYWSRFGFGEQSYKLYRARIGSEEFTIINDDPSVTTECTDYDVEPQTGYKYKLGLEMPDGKEITIGPLSLTSSRDVGNIVLYETTPNPWTDVTEIRYFIPKTISSAQLKVYDITGKLVKTLVDGPQDTGNHTVAWDGTDERGRTVSSGVYFYMLKTRDQKQTRKTLLVR